MVWTVWEGLSWDVWGWGGPSPLVGGWMLPALRTFPPPSEVALGGCAGEILRGGQTLPFWLKSPANIARGFKNPPTSPPKDLADYDDMAFSDKLKTLAMGFGIPEKVEMV